MGPGGLCEQKAAANRMATSGVNSEPTIPRSPLMLMIGSGMEGSFWFKKREIPNNPRESYDPHSLHHQGCLTLEFTQLTIGFARKS
jgi:hypothetical protein